MEKQVRVRIAPSPTGDPHVGTAYVALFNLAFARKNKGSFILRIEDTDRDRSSKESEIAIFDALKWLGIEWDEGPDIGGPYGPYRQSERYQIYKEYANILVERGAAYPCFCPPERLEEFKKSRKGRITGYDRKCRSIPKDEAFARIRAGEPYVIRLAMPVDGVSVVEDLLRGNVEYENALIDDQVLLKSDGFPTYHLANVVDDHLMKITHVIRAEEWINSTPKHLALYKGFGWEPPKFVHLPLLRNKDKSKISKRKNPVSLLYYRQIGVLPEALLNYLGLIGHSMRDEREVFSLEEFISEFSLERIHLGGPIFDLEKLFWLNGIYIRSLEQDDLIKKIRDTVVSEEQLKPIIPLIRERMRTLGEFCDIISYYTHPSLKVMPSEVISEAKGKDAKEIANLLSLCLDIIDECKKWDPETLEKSLRGFAEEKGLKVSEFFMVLRMSITGRKATPPLFDVMAVMGRAMVVQRLRNIIEALKVYKGHT